MGTDIYKVSYSESWRPSDELLEWCFDNLPAEGEGGASLLLYVPDDEQLDQLVADVKGSNPELIDEFNELIRRFKGHSVYIG